MFDFSRVITSNGLLFIKLSYQTDHSLSPTVGAGLLPRLTSCSPVVLLLYLIAGDGCKVMMSWQKNFYSYIKA